MPESAGTDRLCENDKATLRTRILASRRARAPEARAGADTALCETLGAILRRERERLTAGTPAPAGTVPGDGLVVAGYVPIAGEPAGPELPRVLADAVCPGRLLLPVLRADLDLDWAEYTGPDCLLPAGRGLREPCGPRLGPDAVAEATHLVVPAVAVDRTGVRLGRGGGSYDRALARVPAGVEIISPLYAGELVERLPCMPHDRKVTTVLVADAAMVRVVRMPAV